MKNLVKRGRWSANRLVAPNINWITPDVSINGNKEGAVKHTLQIMVPTRTVVKVNLKSDGVTKSLVLNSGIALTANCGYQFDLLLGPGDTYNIQHEFGTQNPACKIFQDDDGGV